MKFFVGMYPKVGEHVKGDASKNSALIPQFKKKYRLEDVKGIDYYNIDKKV